LKHYKTIFFLLAVIFTLQVIPTTQLLKLIEKIDNVKCIDIADAEKDEVKDEVYYFEHVAYNIDTPYTNLSAYLSIPQLFQTVLALEIETPPPNS
jgi:hypothetical protein